MKKRFCKLLCLLFACLLPFAVLSEADLQSMSLWALNIGKADCLLLQCDGVTYMVDTGSGKTYEAVESALQTLGIRELDGIIVTHTDSDHAKGIKKLLKSDLNIGQLYTSPYYNVSAKKHPVLKAAAENSRSVIFLQSGDTLSFGSGKLTVLGPLSQNEEAENCNSLVLLAEGHGGSILLTGDMEFYEEASLLRQNLLSHVDVLKVGNHGEGDATSSAFITALTPSYAVISTNTAEEPDTPDPRVIELLESWHVETYVTQDSPLGVCFTVNDGNWSVKQQ